MEMLEGAGIPYFYDDQLKCYQIRGDYFMRPVELTLDESLALVALGEHIGKHEQIPFTHAAGRAVAKIRCQMPERIRHELASVDPHLSIKLAAASSPSGTADVYERVLQAIGGRRKLKSRYESANSNSNKSSNQKSFIFAPYSLLFSQRAWYVIGHHEERGEVRCLKLNRFTQIELTDQTYQIPRTFSVRGHLGNAWRMIRGDKTHKVELQFSPEFAETIADTHWHDTQEIDWHEDGSITFRCKVDGLDEIVWWVLSMGPHCHVKAPGELARRVRELAARMLDLYPNI
jgi:proteasome accessory factor B